MGRLHRPGVKTNDRLSRTHRQCHFAQGSPTTSDRDHGVGYVSHEAVSKLTEAGWHRNGQERVAFRTFSAGKKADGRSAIVERRLARRAHDAAQATRYNNHAGLCEQRSDSPSQVKLCFRRVARANHGNIWSQHMTIVGCLSMICGQGDNDGGDLLGRVQRMNVHWTRRIRGSRRL